MEMFIIFEIMRFLIIIIVIIIIEIIIIIVIMIIIIIMSDTYLMNVWKYQYQRRSCSMTFFRDNKYRNPHSLEK